MPVTLTPNLAWMLGAIFLVFLEADYRGAVNELEPTLLLGG
jgi:hypothetical protein